MIDIIASSPPLLSGNVRTLEKDGVWNADFQGNLILLFEYCQNAIFLFVLNEVNYRKYLYNQNIDSSDCFTE